MLLEPIPLSSLSYQDELKECVFTCQALLDGDTYGRTHCQCVECQEGAPTGTAVNRKASAQVHRNGYAQNQRVGPRPLLHRHSPLYILDT